MHTSLIWPAACDRAFAAAATLLAVSIFVGVQKSNEAQSAMDEAGARLQARKNAVLVFGATGKLGREVVAQVPSPAQLQLLTVNQADKL